MAGRRDRSPTTGRSAVGKTPVSPDTSNVVRRTVERKEQTALHRALAERARSTKADDPSAACWSTVRLSPASRHRGGRAAAWPTAPRAGNFDGMATKHAAPPEWRIAYALPNLALPPRTPGEEPTASVFDLAKAPITLGSEDVTIVPATDPRVLLIERAFPATRRFIRGFRDMWGARIEPAVLIYRDGVSLPERLGEALISFRNAVALSTILFGKAKFLKGGSPEVSWSDTFDVYPGTLDDKGRLGINTAAARILNWGRIPAPFHGVSAPHIARAGKILQHDQFLYRALGAEWRRRFVRPTRKDRFGQVLFRSLQVAMHAAAVPIKNQGSIYDFGVQLGLWVSALEILARWSKDNANEDVVLDLVAKAAWVEPKLQRPRYTIRRQKDSRRVNAIQYACHVLYHARNDFLHGNPVRLGRLKLRPDEEGVALPAVAAIVYRAALAVYLQPRYTLKLRDLKESPSAAWEGVNKAEYEDAMMEVFGLESSSPSRRSLQRARRQRR